MTQYRYDIVDRTLKPSDLLRTQKFLLQRVSPSTNTRPLTLSGKDIEMATRIRMFAKKNDAVFFGSVHRPKPYDFNLETAYCQSRGVYDILYGFIHPYLNGWIELGKFNYFVDTRRKKQTIVGGAGYMRVYIPNNLPHIMLFALNTARNPLELSLATPNMEECSLEGDFPRHFLVFSDHISQKSVHEVLTPDVMQILKDDFADYDVEISQNGLFAISNSITLDSALSVRRAVELSSWLTHEMLYQIHDISESEQRENSPLSSDAYVKTRPQSTISWKGFMKDITLALIILAPILTAVCLLMLAFGR